MKNLVLNVVILLNLYNHAITSMGLSISDEIYTICQVEKCSTPMERGMVITNIELKKYDKENFNYNIEYRQEYKTSVAEQRLNLKIMIPYCLPNNRDRDFKLTFREYQLSTPHADKVMFLNSTVSTEEGSCNISNFNELNEKTDNVAYTLPYWVTNCVVPTSKNPALVVPITPKRILFIGKCPVRGFSIYKLYWDESVENNITSKNLSNPFLLFSQELICKRSGELIFFHKESSIQYSISLLNPPISIADTKKQIIIKFILQEYAKNFKGLHDLIDRIMYFVDQTCLIENEDKNMDMI